MALTQNTYTADGTTTKYSIQFEYLRESDVNVSLNGVQTTAFTLANATTVNLNSPPDDGVTVRVFRSTDNEELASRFFAGSAIRASDLNKNFEQTLFSVQEVLNRFIDRTQAVFENIINMGNFKITNMARGVDGKDAVNKDQLDEVAQDVSTAVTRTETARDDAIKFATNAEDTQFAYNSANYYSALHYAAKADDSETAATAARNVAQQFATNPENSAFTYDGTSYNSALHHAEKAKDYSEAAATNKRDTIFYGFHVNETGNLICTYSQSSETDNGVYNTEAFKYKGGNQYYIGNNDLMGNDGTAPNGANKPVFNLHTSVSTDPNLRGHLLAPIQT